MTPRNIMTATQTAVDISRMDPVMDAHRSEGERALIPVLQEIQEIYGYLAEPALERVSEEMNLPMSRIYGVATFYAQFYLTPHGRNTIRACRGTACHVRGGKAIQEAIRRILGIEEGETTEDMEFTFESVACFGTCFLAPVAIINNEYFGRLTPKKMETILREYAGVG